MNAEYEKLLKRIEGKLSKDSTVSTARFELPAVDVMWEGQRTLFRNFADYPKIMRRDPLKLLQYLSKEFAVPAEYHFLIVKHVVQNLQLRVNTHNVFCTFD